MSVYLYFSLLNNDIHNKVLSNIQNKEQKFRKFSLPNSLLPLAISLLNRYSSTGKTKKVIILTVIPLFLNLSIFSFNSIVDIYFTTNLLKK